MEDYSDLSDVLHTMFDDDIDRCMMLVDALTEDKEACKLVLSAILENAEACKLVCEAIGADEIAYQSMLAAIRKHPDSGPGMFASLEMDLEHIDAQWSEQLHDELERWADEAPDWLDD